MTYEAIKQYLDEHGWDNKYLIRIVEDEDDGTKKKPAKRVHDCKITLLNDNRYQEIGFDGIDTDGKLTHFYWNFNDVVSIEVQQKEWWKQT